MLIIDGKPVPGTEWCQDWTLTGLRFAPPYPGCAPRRRKVTLGVGHWTGGEAGTRTSLDDGDRVYRVLKTRVDEKGDPMPLSVHFTIGFDGSTWQHADPALVECFHASAVNDESWGAEIINAGFPPNAEGRDRPTVEHRVHGRDVAQLAFANEQLAAWCRLCDAVSDALGIERRVLARAGKSKKAAAEPLSDRISNASLRKFESTGGGTIEHLHCSSKKLDGGTQLTRALLAHGYEPWSP